MELRPKEFDLLLALARDAGRVVPRDRLMADVWDENWYGPTKTLDIHVWALRQKIDARTVRVDDAEVDLRPKEFDLLVALARNAGRVVTRERLLSDVWDEHWFGPTKTLDIHIWALRRKLDPPDRPSRISTVRGVGYRLDAR